MKLHKVNELKKIKDTNQPIVSQQFSDGMSFSQKCEDLRSQECDLRKKAAQIEAQIADLEKQLKDVHAQIEEKVCEESVHHNKGFEGTGTPALTTLKRVWIGPRIWNKIQEK